MAQVPSARMVTPEAVALEFRTANLGSRILAYLLDMVIVTLGILAGLLAAALIGQASDVVVPDWVALTIVLVLLPGWWLGYFIAFETLWRGRTPGKAALGLRVVTKEGAPVRFRHAAIRALLGIVDFLVMGGFFAVVFILLTRDNQRLGDLVAGTLVLRPGWWLGYFIAFETLWRGRTPGKAALGLRVVTKEGAPVRFRHAAIRALLGIVDFLVMGGFFAVVFILLTRDNQRLGDLVAGTLVLRERSALAAPAPVSFAPPPGLEGYAATLDPSGIGTEEYLAVRTFLTRAPSLAAGPRSALALQLANPLAAKLRPPAPTGISPEAYLRCVAAAYQQRQRMAAPAAPPAVAPPPPVAQRTGEGARPTPGDQDRGGFAPPG